AKVPPGQPARLRLFSSFRSWPSRATSWRQRLGRESRRNGEVARPQLESADARWKSDWRFDLGSDGARGPPRAQHMATPEHTSAGSFAAQRAGGFPFTTLRRSHVGLIIALTPRGDEGPEELWGQF